MTLRIASGFRAKGRVRCRATLQCNAFTHAWGWVLADNCRRANSKVSLAGDRPATIAERWSTLIGASRGGPGTTVREHRPKIRALPG